MARRRFTKKQQKLLISLTVTLVVLLAGAFGLSEKLGLPVLSASAGSTAGYPAAPAAADTLNLEAGSIVPATVIRVVDGDTVHLKIDSQDVTVRLVGVDTPEDTKEHETYGPEASAYTRRLLLVGSSLWVEVAEETHDRYGRLLAYLWLVEPPDGRQLALPNVLAKDLVNARILERGWGEVLIIKPNVAYRSQYEALQRQARLNQRGIWQ